MFGDTIPEQSAATYTPSSRLHTFDDPCNHASILSPLLAFEHDTRMLDDEHLVAARKE